MNTILLTGANGQVGWELQRTLGSCCRVIALTRDQLDLSQPDAIRRAVRTHQPDIIINPAAYTAVDKAESEPELALAINGSAPGILAEEAKELDALLVHYSTDYVFDGNQSEPYTEGDSPNPQSVYGRTKLAGEQAIRTVGGKHLILRTSWVYGEHGNNFVKTVLRLAKTRNELRIVSDQYGAPTWARLLANSTALLLQRWQEKDGDPGLCGLYNLTAAGRTSWFQYTQEIVRLAGQYDTEIANKTLAIQPIATSEYPLPAKRPANSVLATDKIKHAFALVMPLWQDDLACCVRDLYALG
jgi:dTDP-4-dehydrorhamnose reductase